MTGDSILWGKKVRNARNRAGLTQYQLGQAIGGISQSRISELESGVRGAVSEETLQKLIAHLGLESNGTLPKSTPVTRASSRKSCLRPQCSSCDPVVSDGGDHPVVHFVPIYLARPQASHCPLCGEPLLSGCQSCEAPLGPGLFCDQCGKPLVRTDDVDPSTAEERRLRNQQLRDTLGFRDHRP